MLKQLVLTTMLTTGVATTVTPVYNAPNTQNLTEQADSSSQNIIQDYTLNLTNTYRDTLVNQNQRINNTSGYYEEGYISDTKYNVSGHNDYLNVLGNLYKTNVYIRSEETPENEDIYCYRNSEYYQDANVDIYPVQQGLYIFKITPYNYNVDTDIRVNLTLEVEPINLYYTGGDTVSIQNVYMKRDIYTTASSNWDSLIDQTLVKNQCKRIIDEIKDINNGFFYDYTTSINDLGYDENGDYSYIDQLEISITPQHDNYIVVNYIPLVSAYMYDNNAQDTYNYAWVNVMASGQLFNPTTVTITGTNVIVNTNYEVVDIPGLMWHILTMPFAFVSQAFNLTLFPGTPYQINISNLFLSIVAIVVFVWLISIFLKLRK